MPITKCTGELESVWERCLVTERDELQKDPSQAPVSTLLLAGILTGKRRDLQLGQVRKIPWNDSKGLGQLKEISKG